MNDIDRYRRSMTEAQMEQGIRDIVERRGGRVFHLRDARTSPELKDMPDLLIICPPYVGVIESKSMRRPITDGQRGVLDLLESCDQLLTGLMRPILKPGEIGYTYDDLAAILKGEWE